jgi:hypothetical protein
MLSTSGVKVKVVNVHSGDGESFWEISNVGCVESRLRATRLIGLERRRAEVGRITNFVEVGPVRNENDIELLH